MASWKKVIVSGSDAILNSSTVGTNQVITTLQSTTKLTGSFTGSFTSTTASVVVLADQKFSGSYGTGDACEALTPYIQSQLISNTRYNLFQFETITAGNTANTKIKVGISNVKAAGTTNGTDYGTFTVVVRQFNDTDKKKTVVETYSNVNLDPNSPNFISRVIGDRKRSIDVSVNINLNLNDNLNIFLAKFPKFDIKYTAFFRKKKKKMGKSKRNKAK